VLSFFSDPSGQEQIVTAAHVVFNRVTSSVSHRKQQDVINQSNFACFDYESDLAILPIYNFRRKLNKKVMFSFAQRCDCIQSFPMKKDGYKTNTTTAQFIGGFSGFLQLENHEQGYMQDMLCCEEIDGKSFAEKGDSGGLWYIEEVDMVTQECYITIYGIHKGNNDSKPRKHFATPIWHLFEKIGRKNGFCAGCITIDGGETAPNCTCFPINTNW